MEKKPERKIYLDAAKGWGILMVMYGHIAVVRNPFDLYFSIYKISIFFIVSGYLMHLTGSMQRYTLRSFAARSVKSIGVPYFCYSMIFIVYRLVLDLLYGADPGVIRSHLINRGYMTVSLRGYSTMWFLSALFIGELLFAWIWRRPVWVRILAGLLVLPACLPVWTVLKNLEESLSPGMYKLISYPILAISRGILAFGYISIGYLLYGILDRICKIRQQLAAGLLCSGAVIFLCRFLSGSDLNHMRFGKPIPLFLLGSILGPIGILLLFRGIEHWYKMPLLSWAGRNSLVIMATHGTLRFQKLTYEGFRTVYSLAEQGGWIYGLQCIGIEIHLLLMEAGVVAVVNRCFPFLAGRGFREKDHKNQQKS